MFALATCPRRFRRAPTLDLVFAARLAPELDRELHHDRSDLEADVSVDVAPGCLDELVPDALHGLGQVERLDDVFHVFPRVPRWCERLDA
jgi:hypothetical protein